MEELTSFGEAPPPAAVTAADPPATVLSPPGTAARSGPLSVGQAFGDRYHILKLLGSGGMGAVYQAWDQELGVAVALKVIRPEVLRDPGAAADLERRFKRELLLARQVTHKNVVRIHDLGEIDGVKYITMPYVEGADLATILRHQGTLPVARACHIARQVAAGLTAAHEAGVIHRDLKPANVMIGPNDHALIMDFGIARSTSGAGDGTALGAVVGTLEYMAPEQARGVPVDHRVDIYAFGLILYDMLVGRHHASAGESAVVELMNRMQHAPRSIRTIDPAMPEPLDRVVDRCVQPDPAARYPSVEALAADLESIGDGSGTLAAPASSAVRVPVVPPTAGSRRWIRYVAAGVLAAIVAGAGGMWLARERLFGRPGAAASNAAALPAVAILPFRNVSGDPALDWLSTGLADMLTTDVGDASVRTVSSERVFRVLADLRVKPAAGVDDVTVRRVADFSGAGYVVTGQYVRLGESIRIDVTLAGIAGQPPRSWKAEAPNEKGVFSAVSTLARSIRESLRGAEAALADLKRQPFKPSSESVTALRHFSDGVQLSRQGRYADARTQFESAVKADANFALGYSKLAETYAALRYDDRAREASQRAFELSEALPPREKYTIAAAYALIRHDQKKAAESYQQLLQLSPDDPAIHFQLATLRESEGSFEQAREHLAKVLQADPKYVAALLAMGRIEVRRRNPQGALEHLNQALSLASILENHEAKADILQAIGIAYKRLNKPDEALGRYEESLAIKRRLDNKAGMAASLNEIAQVHELLGRPEKALASYTEALAIRRELGDKKGIANALNNLGLFYQDRGQYDEALKRQREALQIHRELGDLDLQAQSFNNIGVIYLALSQHDEALTNLERALELREKLKAPSIAETLHNLGEAQLKNGQYDRALKSYYDALDLKRKAGNKRAEAIDLFAIGTLFEHQGRYGAALKSIEEALQIFRDLQDRSYWMAVFLNGYGGVLIRSGNAAAAEPVLREALTIARQLQNQPLIAQILNSQGDRLYYEGHASAARPLYEDARQIATRSEDRPMIAVSQMNLARLLVRDRPAQAATVLPELRREADALGLKHLAAECSVLLADALARTKRLQPAQTEAERALAASKEMGLQVTRAQAHTALAAILAAKGDAAAAAKHKTEARSLLEEVRKETGRDAVLKRADLNAAM